MARASTSAQDRKKGDREEERQAKTRGSLWGNESKARASKCRAVIRDEQAALAYREQKPLGERCDDGRRSVASKMWKHPTNNGSDSQYSNRIDATGRRDKYSVSLSEVCGSALGCTSSHRH